LIELQYRNNNELGWELENGLAELSWAGSLLQILVYVVVVGFVLWMVLSLIGYFHRRAYNLTVSESARGGKSPDFLDNTGRSERIREKAKPFDERMAAEAAARSATSTDKFCSLVRSVTSLASILTFVVAIIGAVARIQMYDSFVENVSSLQHFINIIKTYLIGATVAGVIILVQLIRVVITLRRNKAK